MPRSLSFAAVSVLHALATGAAYGFEVIDSTGLPSGTVYPALGRLERDGLVTSSWEDAAIAQEEKRPPRRRDDFRREWLAELGRRRFDSLTLASSSGRRSRSTPRSSHNVVRTTCARSVDCTRCDAGAGTGRPADGLHGTRNTDYTDYTDSTEHTD